MILSYRLSSVFCSATSHGNSFRKGELCFPHQEMGRHLWNFTHFAWSCKQDLTTQQYAEDNSVSGDLPPCYVLSDSVCPISGLIYIPFSFSLLSQPLPTVHHLPASSSWWGGKSNYPVAPSNPHTHHFKGFLGWWFPAFLKLSKN